MENPFYLDHSQPITPQVIQIIKQGEGDLTQVILTPEVYLKMLAELKKDKDHVVAPDGQVWMIGGFTDLLYPKNKVSVEMAMYCPVNGAQDEN